MGKKRRKGRGCLTAILTVLILGVAGAAGMYFLFPDSGLDKQVKEYIEVSKVQSRIPEVKIKIKEESLAGRYYYGLLDDEKKIAYKEILQGIQEEDTDIVVHLSEVQDVKEIVSYVLNDSPEIFWFNGSGKVNTFEEKDGTYQILIPDYQYQGGEKEAMQQQIEEAATAFLTTVSQNMTEYEKIKYVYEYLINETDYNLEAPDNQNIYSVFANKSSVCAGYARANQYLLNRLGIFCTYVTGTATTESTGEQPHAWNLVQCDGEYYYVDATWGDPVFSQGEEGPWLENNINYDYLLCNDTELFKTHKPDNTAPLPACTSNRYNYYVLNGMYYETFDQNIIWSVMQAAIDRGDRQTYFKFANDEVYRQAYDTLMNGLLDQAGRYLCDRYGLWEVQYSYQEDEVMDKIVIFWNYG